MKFEMSTNFAVQTENPNEAIDFYSKVLGFKNNSDKVDFGDHDADPLRLFVQRDSQTNGVVMELFVDDLELAKEYLTRNGCKIIRWEGLGKDCYIKDPFGVKFNIWQKNS